MLFILQGFEIRMTFLGVDRLACLPPILWSRFARRTRSCNAFLYACWRRDGRVCVGHPNGDPCQLPSFLSDEDYIHHFYQRRLAPFSLLTTIHIGILTKARKKTKECGVWVDPSILYHCHTLLLLSLSLSHSLFISSSLLLVYVEFSGVVSIVATAIVIIFYF
jgi:hypothetical protein